MPWKQKSPMDLRREFIKRLAANERLTDLCREYGISRKTGSKFKKRFEELGVTGLADRSRAPKVIPHKTPPEVEEVILAERKGHPSGGHPDVTHVPGLKRNPRSWLHKAIFAAEDFSPSTSMVPAKLVAGIPRGHGDLIDLDAGTDRA